MFIVQNSRSLLLLSLVLFIDFNSLSLFFLWQVTFTFRCLKLTLTFHCRKSGFSKISCSSILRAQVCQFCHHFQGSSDNFVWWEWWIKVWTTKVQNWVCPQPCQCQFSNFCRLVKKPFFWIVCLSIPMSIGQIRLLDFTEQTQSLISAAPTLDRGFWQALPSLVPPIKRVTAVTLDFLQCNQART